MKSSIAFFLCLLLCSQTVMASLVAENAPEVRFIESVYSLDALKQSNTQALQTLLASAQDYHTQTSDLSAEQKQSRLFEALNEMGLLDVDGRNDFLDVYTQYTGELAQLDTSHQLTQDTLKAAAKKFVRSMEKVRSPQSNLFSRDDRYLFLTIGTVLAIIGAAVYGFASQTPWLSVPATALILFIAVHGG